MESRNSEKAARSPAHAPPPSPTSGVADESPEVLVKRILTCKTHYEVLGVDKAASEVTIKTQYKRIALKVHPDKNKTPKADEAFKRVGQAFACLSDPEKKKMYDMTGSDDPVRTHPFSQRSNPFGEADLTPEEIFGIFFGLDPRMTRRHNSGPQRFNDPPPFTRTHFQSFRSVPRTRPPPQNPTFWGLFMQLLPFLILILFLFWPRPEPAFQFVQTSIYSFPKITQFLKVEFFVKSDFESSYSSEAAKKVIEQQVEEEWVFQMREKCYSARSRKKRLEDLGNFYGNAEMLKKARDVSLESCEMLEKKKIRIN